MANVVMSTGWLAEYRSTLMYLVGGLGPKILVFVQKLYWPHATHSLLNNNNRQNILSQKKNHFRVSIFNLHFISVQMYMLCWTLNFWKPYLSTLNTLTSIILVINIRLNPLPTTLFIFFHFHTEIWLAYSLITWNVLWYRFINYWSWSRNTIVIIIICGFVIYKVKYKL